MIRRTVFGRQKAKTNTFIGGVSASLGTPALLATKLGINVSRISNFSIVGSDIKCNISGGTYLFYNSFISDPNITYFDDRDGLARCLNGYYAFAFCDRLYYINLPGTLQTGNYLGRGCPLLKTAYLPSVTQVSNGGFYESKIDRFYIPNATLIGGSNTAYNECFNRIFFQDNALKTIYAHPSLATINAGAEEPDIAYARSLGATIRYVTNFTPPNAISNLSAGTIYNSAVQLNFTPPSSTNAIDYYEVYVNGAFHSEIKASGGYVVGLSAATNYNISLVAVDVFYNKSSLGNILNVTTGNSAYTDTDALNYISVAALTNERDKDSINLICEELKTNGLWTKIQAFYPLRGDTSNNQKYNLKNTAQFTLIFNGGGTHSRLGYQCNGNAYANTGFAPSVNQNVNSNGLTIIVGTNNNAQSADLYEMGAYDGTKVSSIAAKNEIKLCILNGGVVGFYGDANSRGVLTGSKTSSTVTKLFFNSVLGAVGNSGGTLPTINIWIGALNLNNSAYGYSYQRIQTAIIHEGLTDAEVATLHEILDTAEQITERKTW
jgi:hypothetical protein